MSRGGRPAGKSLLIGFSIRRDSGNEPFQNGVANLVFK